MMRRTGLTRAIAATFSSHSMTLRSDNLTRGKQVWNSKICTLTSKTTNQETLLRSFANLDHQRTSRTGFCEVIFGEGKTAPQIAAIFQEMGEKQEKGPILASRVSDDIWKELSQLSISSGTLEYHKVARMVQLRRHDEHSVATSSASGTVAICTAGTTDGPVASEICVTLESLGVHVDNFPDVGVAGLHRILGVIDKVRQAKCVIVVAGMDGALPSVVAGLVDVPVIAVPTSVGYGAALNGIAPLLTMLNTCSPGVAVVNIDNGIGAAGVVYKMLQNTDEASDTPKLV